MHMRRVFIYLLCVLCWLSSPASAQPPQRLIATLDRAGTITVRFAGSQRVYATLRPGIFESMWQFRTASPKPET